MNLKAYQAAFDQVEQDYEAAVAGFGLPIEATESQPRSLRAATAARLGCHCENGGGSVWRGWLSPACVACRTGERTLTFFIDLRCTRKCYFCFNPNQDYFEHFQAHKRNITAELEDAHAHGAAFDVLAVTGGEPMLYRAEVLTFLRRARGLYPAAHIRLYTSGDCLDETGAEELAAAGLTEIRFSIKPDDDAKTHARLYALMANCKRLGLDVVIEVPVIPGTEDAMRAMLVRAAEAGIDGVNLLEFCFPLHNADEFARRGFELRKHPYTYLYNYWYGGGVPVAGSEALAFALMEFATARGLALGLHYCSSDNKNTGQIYQQNLPLLEDAAVQARYPWLDMSDDGYYLVCAKAFGEDVDVRGGAPARWLDAHGIPYHVDADVPCVAFPHAYVPEVHAAFPAVELGISVNVLEQNGDAAHADPHYLRELAVEACDSTDE